MFTFFYISLLILAACEMLYLGQCVSGQTQGISALVHTEDTEQRLSSFALLLGHTEKMVHSNAWLMLLI